MKRDIRAFHESISKELQFVKNRVRQLIGDSHWGEEGRYKEEILKDAIKKHLPEQFAVGTGFVLGIPPTITSQIDIIVYDKAYPVLFRQGDFIVINPDGVRAIIEVKTNITVSQLGDVVIKASKNGESILGSIDNKPPHFFNGVFSYGWNGDKNKLLHKVQEGIVKYKQDDDHSPNFREGDQEKAIVNHMSFSENIFLKFWNAGQAECDYRGYNLSGLATSYFLFTLMSSLTDRPSRAAMKQMFPLESKEITKFGSVKIRS